MTAPYTIQPLPVPQINPSYVQPGPTAGDYLMQGASSLAQVLMAQQKHKLNQQKLAQDRELTLGQQDLTRLQEQRLLSELSHSQGRDLDVGLAIRSLLGLGPASGGTPIDIGGPQSVGTDTTSVAGALSRVSPRNAAAAVDALGKTRDLMSSKAADVSTTDTRNWDRYIELKKTDPTAAAEFRKFFLDPKPGNSVSVNLPPGETEFAKERAKVRAGLYSEAVQSAKNALQSFPRLSDSYNLVDKSFTGAGANAKLFLSRGLAAFGVKPSGDAATDTQELIKNARERALTYLRGRDLGAGTAVSDGDRTFVEGLAGADITLESGTLKRIFRINLGTDIMKIEDTIAELRSQAHDYPSDAASLNREAEGYEQKLRPLRARHAEMLTGEGKNANQAKSRIDSILGGIQP